MSLSSRLSTLLSICFNRSRFAQAIVPSLASTRTGVAPAAAAFGAGAARVAALLATARGADAVTTLAFAFRAGALAVAPTDLRPAVGGMALLAGGAAEAEDSTALLLSIFAPCSICRSKSRFAQDIVPPPRSSASSSSSSSTGAGDGVLAFAGGALLFAFALDPAAREPPPPAAPKPAPAAPEARTSPSRPTCLMRPANCFAKTDPPPVAINACPS
mmetsp:Transcript_160699/g.293535  ORF Transcript_160699/g.293535 Transcript_160699/m.293535 type:complete len:216 (-) Transcript_160699:52-699(-)